MSEAQFLRGVTAGFAFRLPRGMASWWVASKLLLADFDWVGAAHKAIKQVGAMGVLFVSTLLWAGTSTPLPISKQHDLYSPVLESVNGWQLAQAGIPCNAAAPTGVEDLLVRQASEVYSQAQRAQGNQRRGLLQRTLALIDAMVQSQPNSSVACQARQPGGTVGGIPVAQVRAELASSAYVISRPVSVDEALARAAAAGPSVDLVKAYMYVGQFEQGLQLLVAGVPASTYGADANATLRISDTHLEVADWLTDLRRSDLAVQVLNQAVREIRTTEMQAWADLASGYHRAGSMGQAQAIFSQWELAIATERPRRPDRFYSEEQHLIETYIGLDRIEDVRRIAATLPVDSCGYPFEVDGFRLQAYLGQPQQALEAAKRCRDPERQFSATGAVSQVALGLAESGNLQAAQALYWRELGIRLVDIHKSRRANALAVVRRTGNQQVQAGALALAAVQRQPSRLPSRSSDAGADAARSRAIERSLTAYIERYPDGRFLDYGDPPGWFDGQCVAWAKRMIGQVSSRPFDEVRAPGAHELASAYLSDGRFQSTTDPTAPKPGAMIFWEHTNGLSGHVGVVTQLHYDPATGRTAEVTVSEANWGEVTHSSAEHWGLELSDAQREFVTEMYGVARSVRLAVSDLSRGNYRFIAYVYP